MQLFEARKMNKLPKQKCQIPDCHNQAKYGLYKTYQDGTKHWLHVCEYHEKIIGHENILRARRLEM